MGFLQPLVTRFGGRRLVLGLGVLYVVLVVGFPFLPAANDAWVELWVVLGILAGIPGLVLLYGGYRLLRTDIRPEFYPTVGVWCLRGVGLGLAIMVPIVIASNDGEIFSNALLLTALGSLAGFGAGSYDAEAKTRTHQLQETVDQLQISNDQLERYQQYTDDILDSIDDVFYVLTEDGELERWNESLSEVTGYTADEISSMTAAEFFEDDAREKSAASVREGFETGATQSELELRTKEGETFPFEFVASRLKDPSGETVLAGIGRDVSARVEREQRLKDSNERLEQFAYAASHDLQEPLRMVSSYLQLLESRYDDELDEDGAEFIEFAVDGAERMRDMIHGLLEYSRVETQGNPFEPVDLNAVFDGALDDLQVQIEETNAQITIEDLPVVEGDFDQLRQVFQNLLANATQYTGGERPQVHVSAERAGSEWRVSIRDEGIGIASADQERIFDVFQRLHDRKMYEGTGIGLALCQRIIERHGGEIQVESELGEGSTFTVVLQAAAETATGANGTA